MRLRFERSPPPAAGDQNRMDVVCFVGCIARRALPTPEGLVAWLRQQGFVGTTPDADVTPRADVWSLREVPVPVDSWQAFDELFAWQLRPVSLGSWAEPQVLVPPCTVKLARTHHDVRLGQPVELTTESGAVAAVGRVAGVTEAVVDVRVDELVLSAEASELRAGWSRGDQVVVHGARLPEAPSAVSWLGAAVRAFFAAGGRRCYVVRVGDPWPADAPAANRRALLEAMVPGLGAHRFERHDRRSWRGLGLVLNLPDVALVSLPDLPDAAAQPALPQPPEEVVAPPLEGFADCVDVLLPPDGATTRPMAAPRLSEADWATWQQAASLAGRWVASHRRDVQLVAALPLPTPESPAARDPLAALLAANALRALDDQSAWGLAGRFVQLAWPWVRWTGSVGLPEGLQPPDGLLAGLIVANTLAQGAFTSAAGRQRLPIVGFEPALSAAQQHLPGRRDAEPGDAELALIDRVCLLGPTPRGVELLSDVTLSGAEAWRPGNVTRLFSVVLRALQQLGEDQVFDVSGPTAWLRVRTRVEALLTRLWELGGLNGRTPNQAFRVTCDRSTMTQNDLDQGRLIAVVEVAPAAAIERITVVLAVSDEGRLWQVAPLAALLDEEAA